jgi:hypothetical protein
MPFPYIFVFRLMNSLSAAMLADPEPSAHIAYLYANDSDLADAVALFASAGFSKREAAILIATSEHKYAIRERLAQDGFELSKLEKSGQLTFASATDLIATFIHNGTFDEHLFKSDFAALINTALHNDARTNSVRIFGEMVDLLSTSQPELTLRLEQLGNELIAGHSLTVLCGYSLRRSRPLPVRPVLECHSHICG